MFSLKYLFFCQMLSLVTVNEAARILAVFPVPSISHQVVFRPLTQELVKRGHEVVVITPDPAFPKGQTPANLTEIDVHEISYNTWHELVSQATGKKNDLKEQVFVGMRLISEIFLKQMNSDEVKDLIQNEKKFDLLLLEACVRPALSLSHTYKVPVIQVSSFGSVPGNYKVLGAPTHPILYPGIFRQRVYNLTFWEKITELYNHYKYESYFDNELADLDNKVLDSLFHSDKPTLHELGNYVHMLFLNTNPIWEGNVPVPPGVIHMGGLHQKPEKKLPEDLQNYLDSSKDGVVYVSFGTNVKPSLLQPEKIQMLIKVFSELPFNVLWKWDKDELPGKTKNIKIFKWLPQSDLLRHPNIKLFIMQGGLQSTDEAINAGVPLIGIPMLADQWYNTEKYEHFKIGVKLEMETLTEGELRNAIYTVVKDKSFRRNIERLRTLIDDQPMRPLERAVWWTEYVLRHGGAMHLRAPAANMSWAQYLELELVSIVLLALITVLLALIGAIYYIVKLYSTFKTSIRMKKMD